MDRNISVIVTVYGIERHIERALRSLLGQSMTDGAEFIIVNDASPDRSPEIARRVAAEYPGAEVRFVDTERNGGVAAARMRGMAEARGEYLLFQDGDDFVEPEMLEEMWRTARETDADIVVSDFWMEWPRRRVLYTQEDVTVAGLVGGRLHGAMWNKLVRRSLYDKHGIGFTPGLNMWEDLAVCVELFLHARRIVRLPRAFVHYVQHPASSLRRMTQVKLDNIVTVVERIETLLTEHGLNDNLAPEIEARKWFALHCLVRNTRGEEQKKYLAMWSELGARPGPIAVAAPFRRALRQAREGRPTAANTVYNMVDILKKCRLLSL